MSLVSYIESPRSLISLSGLNFILEKKYSELKQNPLSIILGFVSIKYENFGLSAFLFRKVNKMIILCSG